jgi:predicted DNA-binding ribbon-helix-helix protein
MTNLDWPTLRELDDNRAMTTQELASQAYRQYHKTQKLDDFRRWQRLEYLARMENKNKLAQPSGVTMAVDSETA